MPRVVFWLVQYSFLVVMDSESWWNMWWLILGDVDSVGYPLRFAYCSVIVCIERWIGHELLFWIQTSNYIERWIWRCLPATVHSESWWNMWWLVWGDVDSVEYPLRSAYCSASDYIERWIGHELWFWIQASDYIERWIGKCSMIDQEMTDLHNL